MIPTSSGPVFQPFLTLSLPAHHLRTASPLINMFTEGDAVRCGIFFRMVLPCFSSFAECVHVRVS